MNYDGNVNFDLFFIFFIDILENGFDFAYHIPDIPEYQWHLISLI